MHRPLGMLKINLLNICKTGFSYRAVWGGKSIALSQDKRYLHIHRQDSSALLSMIYSLLSSKIVQRYKQAEYNLEGALHKTLSNLLCLF